MFQFGDPRGLVTCPARGEVNCRMQRGILHGGIYGLTTIVHKVDLSEAIVISTEENHLTEFAARNFCFDYLLQMLQEIFLNVSI